MEKELPDEVEEMINHFSDRGDYHSMPLYDYRTIFVNFNIRGMISGSLTCQYHDDILYPTRRSSKKFDGKSIYKKEWFEMIEMNQNFVIHPFDIKVKGQDYKVNGIVKPVVESTIDKNIVVAGTLIIGFQLLSKMTYEECEAERESLWKKKREKERIEKERIEKEKQLQWDLENPEEKLRMEQLEKEAKEWHEKEKQRVEQEKVQEEIQKKKEEIRRKKIIDFQEFVNSVLIFIIFLLFFLPFISLPFIYPSMGYGGKLALYLLYAWVLLNIVNELSNAN